jgi:pimeloyl-ACP methyl ester carboxylesterase
VPERISLLLLPGLLCDERLWQDQAASLTKVAAPLIADLTLDESIAAMARRALAAAPDRFALAALSMGGYVAFEILRQAPQRVSRLALLATSAAPDTPERAARRRAAIASLKLGRFQGVTNRMLPQLIHPDRVGSEVGAEVRAMAERVGGEAFLRQQAAILGRPDSRALLASITVPTLVGVGDADMLTPPAESEAIHRAIGGSELYIFSRCGHLPAMECPAETTELLRRWLTGGSGTVAHNIESEDKESAITAGILGRQRRSSEALLPFVITYTLLTNDIVRYDRSGGARPTC